MSHPDPTYVSASSLAGQIVKYGLQPVALVLILWYWLGDASNPLAFAITIGALHLVLGVLERVMPARPGWNVSGWIQTRNIVLVVLLTLGVGAVAALYDELLRAPLAEIRAGLHLDFWPAEWPLLAQVLLVLPAALVELTFGVGAAAAGAAILGTAQTSIAHSNLDLNSKVIGWLFTTNRYHIHHHSMVLEESNTNYGCSAIIWDRLFGTFTSAHTLEAGTGPTEPSLWGKFLMPFREPADTAIAPDH